LTEIIKEENGWIWYKCDNCNKINKKVKGTYLRTNNHFCNRKCFGEWLSKNTKGENSPLFRHDIPLAERTRNCTWCDKEIHNISPNKLSKQKYFFCSNECKKQWLTKIYMNTDDFKNMVKENGRKVLLKFLESGNSRVTDIQNIINNLLKELNISYKNEKIFGNYAVDNYLIKYNLIIECQGGYWHADNRIYDEIKYDRQLRSIRRDKSKKNFFKNNYNINILFLWEIDIKNNINLCKELIKEYIENNGILEDYNSMNYVLIDGKLSLNKKYNPFMNWDKEDLNNITNLITPRESRLDPSKHITFNCEYCGEEVTQKTYEYNKNKTHCCSVECKNKLKENKITVECSYCGKEFLIKKSTLERKKTDEVFCCREHYELSRSNSIKLYCSCCGKEVHRTNSKIKKNTSGKFYCSQECYQKDNAETLIKRNKEDNPVKYKYAKNNTKSA